MLSLVPHYTLDQPLQGAARAAFRASGAAFVTSHRISATNGFANSVDRRGRNIFISEILNMVANSMFIEHSRGTDDDDKLRSASFGSLFGSFAFLSEHTSFQNGMWFGDPFY
jgi:hypothetical protein